MDRVLVFGTRGEGSTPSRGTRKGRNSNKLIRGPYSSMVEQIPLKDKVAGSSPAGGTKKKILC